MDIKIIHFTNFPDILVMVLFVLGLSKCPLSECRPTILYEFSKVVQQNLFQQYKRHYCCVVYNKEKLSTVKIMMLNIWNTKSIMYNNSVNIIKFVWKYAIRKKNSKLEFEKEMINFPTVKMYQANILHL